MVYAIVNEGFQEDYAKSIARVSDKFFQEFNINPGDIVEIISGETRVPVILEPLEDYQMMDEYVSKI